MSCYFSVLLHYCYFYKLDTISTLNNFFCGNLGLVTRMTHATGPLQPFPRHFLRSDIDLELQIMETIRLLDLTLVYLYPCPWTPRFARRAPHLCQTRQTALAPSHPECRV
jgi:hypothetical protein